jgi:hypothetical protein
VVALKSQDESNEFVSQAVTFVDVSGSSKNKSQGCKIKRIKSCFDISAVFCPNLDAPCIYSYQITIFYRCEDM